jgi:acetoin utilization protein AcuB
MLVKYWMSTNVITVDEDVSMMKASRLMKQHGIQHLPVMRKGRLAGIVSDRDLKEAHPSKASTLDIHELYYLLDQLKVKEIMAQKLHTAHADDTIEKAAALMLKYNISALPIVNDEGHLDGIITKGDLFRALVSISGIYQAGVQVGVELPDQPGSIKSVTDVIRAHGGRIVSIISSYEHAPEGSRQVYIRFKGVKDETGLLAELEKKFKVLYHTRDRVE